MDKKVVTPRLAQGHSTVQLQAGPWASLTLLKHFATVKNWNWVREAPLFTLPTIRTKVCHVVSSVNRQRVLWTVMEWDLSKELSDPVHCALNIASKPPHIYAAIISEQITAFMPKSCLVTCFYRQQNFSIPVWLGLSFWQEFPFPLWTSWKAFNWAQRCLFWEAKGTN